MDLALQEALAHSAAKIRSIVDDTISSPLWIWYDGSGAAATVAVANTGTDLNFTVDAATDGTPGTSGTISLDGAGTDTFLEVANVINVVDGWHCLVVDALNADSANGTLIDFSAVSCYKFSNVKKLKGDTSAIQKFVLAISAEDDTFDDSGVINSLLYLKYTPTYSSGNLTVNIYEAQTKVASWAGSATTVADEYTMTTILHEVIGKKLLLSIENDAAATAFTGRLISKTVKVHPHFRSKPVQISR